MNKIPAKRLEKPSKVSTTILYKLFNESIENNSFPKS